MNRISKKKLDELIALERQYWESHGTTDYKAIINQAYGMEAETGVSAFSIIDLVKSIVANNGFAPDATNDVIYFVLRILGWEATDEEHSSN